MVWNQMPNQPGNFSMMGSGPGGQGGNSGNMADMLNDLMRSKPNFSTDVFGGQVYQSKFKPFWSSIYLINSFVWELMTLNMIEKYQNTTNKSRALQNWENAVRFELYHRQWFASTRISMVFADTICTILTFTALSARNPCVEAFTILFLALTFLTVASFALMSRMQQLVLYVLLCLLDLVLMSLVIATSIAIAILCAEFAFTEALTVHL